MITLISLISDQPIPNLLFIREKLHEVDNHIFVTTEMMEKRGAADRLARVAGLQPDSWQKVVVIEDSLDDIQKKLEKLNLPIVCRPSISSRWFDNLFGKVKTIVDQKYLLNLTGGTKIMSIGISRFFEQFDHESYYVPIGKNAFKGIYPYQKDEAKSFTNSLTLPEYLLVFGFQMKNSGLPVWVTEPLVERFYKYNRKWEEMEAVRALLGWQQKNRNANFDLIKDTRLRDLIKGHFWETQHPDQLSPEEIQFLISGWWEAYIFYKLKNDLELPEDSIAINCHIVRDSVENELDIAFVKNNKLFVVECKTGFGAPRFQEEFNKAIYKLAAIRKNMGLRIPGFLFMLDPFLRHNTKEIKSQFLERASLMDTILVDKVILNNEQKWQSFLDTIS